MPATILDDPIYPPFKWQHAFAALLAERLPDGELLVTRTRMPRGLAGLVWYPPRRNGRAAGWRMTVTHQEVDHRPTASAGLADFLAEDAIKQVDALLAV